LEAGDRISGAAVSSCSFTDLGATCTELVDGVEVDISAQVDSSKSDSFTLAMTGKYAMRYTCVSTRSGLAASPVEREVVVQDTTCPVCALSAGPTTIEASFPFVDPGFSCTDNLDGALTLTAANTDVTNPLDVENVGTYLITYRAHDASSNWNDGCSAPKLVRTVQVVDTLRPVIAVHDAGKFITSSEGDKVADRGVGNQINPMHNYQGFRRRLLESAGGGEANSISTIALAWAGAGMAAALLVGLKRASSRNQIAAGVEHEVI
jgi:hypothetical protein